MLRALILDMHATKKLDEALPPSGTAAELLFSHPLVGNEVLEPIAVDLAKRRFIDQAPFWAELVSLELCTSTAPGLGLMRERPTLRGKLRLLATDTLVRQ